MVVNTGASPVVPQTKIPEIFSFSVWATNWGTAFRLRFRFLSNGVTIAVTIPLNSFVINLPDCNIL